MNCPVCNSKMYIKGREEETNTDLPDSLPSGMHTIPFYECEKCKEDNSPFAYQRLFLKGKWYYYHKVWNFLREEIFNPSRREIS